jgi:hypothetical protein
VNDSVALSFKHDTHTTFFLLSFIQFADSTGFTGKGIGNWNVSNLVLAKEMFAGADQFQEDVSMWNVARLQVFANGQMI